MSIHPRVALVSPIVGRNDGQGRVNYEIARSALEAGWDLTIIATRCDKDLLQFPRLRFVSLNVKYFPTQLFRNFIFALASRLWIKRNRRNIDVLHVNGCVTMARADVNAVHFVHGAWVKNQFYPFRSWWRSPYAAYQRCYSAINAKSELPAFLRSRSVVAVSRKVLSELQSLGIPARQVDVIYNGVDTNEFHPGTPERQCFGLPPEVPLFLFAGDLRTNRKNLETVLSALVDVPGLHLAVAGSIAGSPFPQLAYKLGVSNRVTFLGNVKDMASLMRSVDAFVFPSRYECMSLVLLEALASGLPILTAETAGGAEIIGAAGRILRNPEDVQTLAGWMRDLKDDGALRKSMGETGRAIALTHSWRRMAEQYRMLYSQLAKIPSTPSEHYSLLQ